MMKAYKLGVLQGDGIGPEIVSATVKVFKAAAQELDVKFDWTELPMGWEGMKSIMIQHLAIRRKC